MGIEKPSPIEPELELPNEAIAELIPMRAPLRFTSGPPELPGFIAASVCIASINDSTPFAPVVTGRLRAETIPVVTVPDNPSGEPKATTGSPIAS